MDLPPSDQIQQARASFRLAWNKGLQPSIAKYSSELSEPVRSQLIEALISLEIELRTNAGERPHADDYLSFGSQAVKLAKQCLNDSILSFPNPEQNQTAHYSMEALANASENFSFDEASSSKDLPNQNSQSSSESHEKSKYIGRYKLLQQIGIGGMGAVWMAEQQEPVKRRVALKVIRSDIGSESAVARFEAERQAIALMDHQNIAKILDAGTTESGNPYFVMELVNGIPLNKYCDKRRLGIRERLQLMIPVCRAVQHAHQKGIIHRDLKHSNVLVTEYDGLPVPKVIDFGLAKALGHQHTLTDKTMFTEIGKVVGTIQYMSPEQAETNNLDVDTRTDVYSLGVMIYKLLVGATPIEHETVSQISFLEALRLIREKDPSRPSLRLKVKDETIEELCALRQVQPEKLKQLLEGDIDWIVMKALEKDRNDRYDTANGLAMEIERYLNDEQVLARPPSAIYSVKKFVKRNRSLVASIMTVTFLLVTGIVATGSASWLFLKERDHAKAQTEVAKIETAKAKRAETEARESEERRRKQQELRELELRAMRLNFAWKEWQLGNSETAWLMLNKLSESENGWESRFLRSEFSASETTLFGHSRDVVTLDVSNDGKLIATGAHDDSIKVWDAHTNELIYTSIILDEPTCVRFTPDSKLVACADRTNTITFWQADTGKLEKSFGPFRTDVTTFEFTPDGSKLLVALAASDSYRVGIDRQFHEPTASSLKILSASDGSDVQEVNGHTQDIMSISSGPDGKTFASGSLDNSIRVWRLDGDQYQLLHKLNKHFLGVTGVDISPSGVQLLSCSQDKTIRLWDLETGELSRTFVGHTDQVNSVRFSHDGERIVSSSADRTARVWNRSGEEILVCQGHFNSLTDAAFSTDDQEILTASKDKTVKIWSSSNRPSTVIGRPHSDVVWAADFTVDGDFVASGSEDGTVTISDTHTGNLAGPPIEHETAVLSLAYSPDSSLLAVGGADGNVRVYNTDGSKLIKAIPAHDDFVWGVAFSPDGKQLVSASADATAKIWNTRNWTVDHTLDRHTSELASARFSPDGSMLVTASDDQTVKLWDASTYALRKSFEGHTNTIWKAIFSPSGDLIASSGYDGEVIIWDVAKQELVKRFQAHPNQIAGLAFSHDGSRLVTASDDKTIRIWDVETCIEQFVLRDEGDTQIVHVSFSQDGNKMVSGNSEGWVTIRAVSESAANARPFLPQDGVEITLNGLLVITPRDAAIEDLQREKKLAETCCKYYPSYKTYTNLGIAQYRLGEFEESVENLTEAHRLEPIQYGQPDVRPDIEGFLAMALFKTGELEKANAIRDEFKSKRSYKLWGMDEKVAALEEEIDEVFASTD